MFAWIVNDLIRCLKHAKQREFRVVVMPDFFIDRFAVYPGDAKEFSEAVIKVAGRRGGAIHGVRQVELRGGNAANTASALAVLGAKVYPIITTSPLGFQLLEFYMSPLGVDLYHVKIDGEVALTTALELAHGQERVNVMLGELGSLQNFDPDDLTEDDYRVIKKADYVCVFNWASTQQHGTELAEAVFRYVKEEGKGKTYYDTADPTPNMESIPKLLKKVLQSELVDILSLNENEAFQYASRLDKKVKGLKDRLDHSDVAKECARTLTKHVSARVDLHTSAFAGSFTNGNEVIIPAFPVSPLRSTGAGDSWNAGNMLGDALHLPDSCRLTLANSVAAYYVSNPTAKHPSLPEVIEFCRRQLQTQGSSP